MTGGKGDFMDKVLEIRADELDDMRKRACRLERELRDCRNELCYRCGRYREAHLGACDHCRYKRGGEWEADIA